MNKYNYTIKLNLTSTNLKLLQSYIIHLQKNFQISNIINLPNNLKKYTVLKSPHVNKKAREQFQIKQYNRLININLISKLQFNKFRYLILTNLPASLKIKFIFQKIKL